MRTTIDQQAHDRETARGRTRPPASGVNDDPYTTLCTKTQSSRPRNCRDPRPGCLALSDRQLKLVPTYAAGLPVPMRDRYLREIADRLFAEPSDAAVEQAINLALDRCHTFANGT